MRILFAQQQFGLWNPLIVCYICNNLTSLIFNALCSNVNLWFLIWECYFRLVGLANSYCIYNLICRQQFHLATSAMWTCLILHTILEHFGFCCFQQPCRIGGLHLFLKPYTDLTCLHKHPSRKHVAWLLLRMPAGFAFLIAVPIWLNLGPLWALRDL